MTNQKSQNTLLISLEDAAVALMGTRVLENTSWTITRGQHWLVTGSNGAGKTTLLKAIAGQLPLCCGWMTTNLKKPLSKSVFVVSFDREKSITPKSKPARASIQTDGCVWLLLKWNLRR